MSGLAPGFWNAIALCLVPVHTSVTVSKLYQQVSFVISCTVVVKNMLWWYM